MTSIERRQPSQNLINGIDTCLLDGKSLKDKVNEVLALGKIEGFTDLEMGDIIRQRSITLGLSSSTIRGYLPPAAKHQEKVRVRQLAPDSISKTRFAPDSGAVDYKNLPEQIKTEPEPATYEQRVAAAEEKYGISQDVDDSTLYPSARAKNEVEVERHSEQFKQLQIENAQLKQQIEQLHNQIKELNDKIAISKAIRLNNQDQITRMKVQLRKAGIEPEHYRDAPEATAA